MGKIDIPEKITIIFINSTLKAILDISQPNVKYLSRSNEPLNGCA